MGDAPSRTTSAQVIARAAKAAGSDDFGARTYLVGLEKMLAGLDEAPLNPAAYEAAVARLVASLVNRHGIEAWIRAHPEVEDQVVDGPVIILGLPRTGTTATQALFALDPAFRFFRRWEGLQSTPPPVLGEEDRDPRVVAAREAAKAGNPLAGIHLADPDWADEELSYIGGMNMSYYMGATPMPDSFIDWWIGEDFEATYAYHERVLKLLQSRRPPTRWLLKANPHLFKLEALARRYPHARFIMTHRDPATVIPSVTSLYWKLYQAKVTGPDAVSKAWAGARSMRFWTEGMRRGLEARRRIGEDRFIDVYNDDVIRDPVGTFNAAYERLGMTVTPSLSEALRRFQAENPPGKDGGHRYTAEEYGLTADGIRTGFQSYCEQFGF